MKKGIIIGGLVLVIGGVSYFLYMKEKKKEQGLIAENQPTDENTGATAGATTGATTGATAGATTSAPINKEIPPLSTGSIVSPSVTLMSIEEQNKLDRARDIFERIKQNRLSSISTNKMIDNLKTLRFGVPTPSSLLSMRDSLISQESKLKDELLQIGYEMKGDLNPVLVKLNSL